MIINKHMVHTNNHNWRASMLFERKRTIKVDKIVRTLWITMHSISFQVHSILLRILFSCHTSCFRDGLHYPTIPIISLTVNRSFFPQIFQLGAYYQLILAPWVRFVAILSPSKQNGEILIQRKENGDADEPAASVNYSYSEPTRYSLQCYVIMKIPRG